MRALYLVNHNARRASQLITAATQHLQGAGLELIEPSIELVSDPNAWSKLICDYRDRVDLVIIGGGDGTLNSAAAALIETQLPLGILPLGTANDLARTLGIPPNLEAACQVIVQGHVQAIDLGWVNGHYFFNVASLGLSVNLTQYLTTQVKRKWGVLAYAIAAGRALWSMRKFHARLRTPDGWENLHTLQIAVGNGRFYGGGMAVAEDATIDDQRLDFYSLEIDHPLQWLKILPMMYQGSHHRLPFVYSCQGQEFIVHTRKPSPINTDGEITTMTPAHFRVVPKAIRVLMPPPDRP